MVELSAVTLAQSDAATTFATLVTGEASAAHPYVRTLLSLDSADATRNAGDAIHHLSMLHGRYPGVIDHASARTASDAARRALFKIADSFAQEREFLARLVVAVGPIPSTPGQAETEASVIAQRHAIEMLAQSDRQGCAIGAALAMAYDWHAIRPVLDVAAKRFGIESRDMTLADPEELQEIARVACTTPATERAMLFGVQQIATQHRGLWDLLEVRAKARHGS
jgi:hypothetical protein